MKISTYNKATFFIGLGGVLFSGYLSAVKFFTSTCALNEPCPYFLGYPACWYGFAMFLAIFITAILGLLKRVEPKQVVKAHLIISSAGILFATYFTIPEIDRLMSGTSNYALGLPTCAYGLVFYIIIFILAFGQRKVLTKQ